MSHNAPRCPFCATVLKLEPSIWERIGLKSSKSYCHTCQKYCDARHAHTMGDAYWHWAEMFRGNLMAALQTLPILSDPAMNRALGMPHKEHTLLIGSVDELVRTCLRHQRPVLIEMARGRDATLEVAHLSNETTHDIETAAILGTSSAESGAHESQQLIARQGANHFVLFTHPGKEGAEPRVKRAIHEKGKNTHPSHPHAAHAPVIHTTHAGKSAHPAKHAHHA